MNILHIYYLLSKSCLGELNQSFRRIYFSMNNNKFIKLYFILENFNEYNEESIEEIMSEFFILTENFLEASQLEDNYVIDSEVIINDNYNFFLKNIDDHDFFEEFYRRKE